LAPPSGLQYANRVLRRAWCTPRDLFNEAQKPLNTVGGTLSDFQETKK
jgi:hypothetical protein